MNSKLSPNMPGVKVEAYSMICDILERHFYPQTYVDGILHTSKEVRAAAMDISDLLDQCGWRPIAD